MEITVSPSVRTEQRSVRGEGTAVAGTAARSGNGSSGFTLIETLVAVSLFSILMVMTVGSLTILIDANRKARSEKAVINNLNASLEVITRSMRDGSGYICAPNPSCLGSNSQVRFSAKDGTELVYRVMNNTIERSTDGGSTFSAITSPDVTVQELSFTVVSTGAEVPKFQISMRANTPGEAATGAEFNLQTTVSQRFTYEAPYTDASPECGNGQCEWGEDAAVCSNDCEVITPGTAQCGNGQCEWGENATNCASDCRITTSGTAQCGNGQCEWGENNSNCAADCVVNIPGTAQCGNGQCEWGENATNCASDCRITTSGTAQCGNGQCEWGENATNCAGDCRVANANACNPAPYVYPSTAAGKAVPFCPFRIPSGATGHYIVNFEAGKTDPISLISYHRKPANTECGTSPTWSYGFRKDSTGTCRRYTEPLAYTLSTPIPAGTYDIYMFSWDDHCDATGHCDYIGSANAQDNETIKLRLCNGQGKCTHGDNFPSEIMQTGSTTDIPKNVNYVAPREVNSDVVIPQAIERITPRHYHPHFDVQADEVVNNCLRADGTLYRCSPHNSVVASCALFVQKAGPNACTSNTTNITCTGCGSGGTCNAQCVQPTAGTTNVNCSGCGSGGTCNSRCVQPSSGTTNIRCGGCANGGTCNAQCVQPAGVTTNVTCTNCPSGSCDVQCTAPVAAQSIVTIDCGSCESGGTCPVACVIPPIVSTSSRSADIEEF